MQPTWVAHNSLICRFPSSRRNTPEEHDETMSAAEQDPDTDALMANPNTHSLSSGLPDGETQHDRETHPYDISSFSSYRQSCSLSAGFPHPTPFPSHNEAAWLHGSRASSGSGYPTSLPSCLTMKDYSSWSEDGGHFRSLPGRECSLEQPLSLHSNPPTRHHCLSPYACSPQGAPCCAQCPPEGFNRLPNPHWPFFSPHGPYYPAGAPHPGFSQSRSQKSAAQEKPPAHSASLSLEQRRVFVTYEADNDNHVKEVINFVALLRHNGFDTHIDIFEQQFRSISTIDFMERFLTEKEYLIIIIISPKYYNTVTAFPAGLEHDQRTCNTVYIHKQLQYEFIQNGSKNFRFIPILFPGARKCHVPNWLQNTHVFGWPRDRDDILRRLMRVEKYNPPPVGELPTIVSIPI
ncbi:E3 ubiquitin ligase TRAF3IP2-like isoform X1 [Synchiropus splendidus]|uniref:E3 ubiquitin ligase TRAF3IP2-like isoform X1 n=2 Tax=Synchiropus splendidus TaxID=270530 RepID=UPI00237DC508|nr:E3 ubiquitin ligase TRAF3IP2-like isoform X1 [Synchiropus splendidus]XP_053741974.1 E3 ubiquitin ligase TRAF3IP2-like isoform X1 [Synchiropus splendidus]XP_053741983.1 E3 ubiquitin ligase TRAF3IP2-like isoform X1 [Synchiropus splendidus]